MFSTSINIKTILPVLALSFVLACSGPGGGKSSGGSDDPPPPPPPTVKKMGYFRPMKQETQQLRSSEDSNNKSVNMIHNRQYHTATLLSTGKVLIVGGVTQEGDTPFVRRMEIFDPIDERFSDTGVDSSPRSYCGVIPINDSEVALIGGYTNVPVEIYNSELNQITRKFNLVNKDYQLPGALLNNIKTCWKYPNSNKVGVIGNSGHILEVDLAEETWELKHTLARSNFGLARVGDVFYFFGGIVLPEAISGTPEIIKYDLSTGEVTTLAAVLQNKRANSSAVTTLDGKIGLYGGAVMDSGEVTYPTAVELFDPQTETISTVGNLISQATADYAIQLQNGFTLHLGGFSNGRPTAQQLFYDHATNTSGVTGDMHLKRTNHAITMLLDGRVLITGGNDQSGTFKPTNLAEIYEPEHKLYVVMPKDTCVLGQQLQFSVQYVTADVTWEISKGAGLINQEGLYSAPMEMPVSSEVAIKVTAKNDPTIFAMVRITLVPASN